MLRIRLLHSILTICSLGMLAIFPRLASPQDDIRFQPLPYEDSVKGRNSYGYNAAIDKPASDAERIDFLNKIKAYALSAQGKTKVPACAIGGMAALESGFGFTRTAYFANNIFGIKKWINRDTPDSWQLKGQPDESQGSGCVTKTKKSYGQDQVIFDESTRCDNRYRRFSDYGEAIQDLAGRVLQKSRYRPALEAYWSNRGSGMSIRDACRQYVCDVAKAGYTHIGCTEYLNKVGRVMNKWDIYTWAQEAEVAIGNQ